jgi:hypothetical protein
LSNKPSAATITSHSAFLHSMASPV